MNVKRHLNRLGVGGLLALVAPLVFFLTVFIPVNAYVSNSQEFPMTSVGSLIAVASVLWLLATAVLSALLGLVRMLWPRTFWWLFGMATGCVLGLYVQGNLINLNYGVLDGTAIPWDELFWAGVANTVVWIVIILAAVWCIVWRGGRSPVILKLSLWVFVAYLALVTAMRLVGMKPVAVNALQFVPGDELKLSNDRNVVIFVVDSLEQGVFEDMLREYPELKESLRGFTYYQNTIGKFTVTFMALPQLLTGYDEAQPVKSEEPFKDRAYRGSAFFRSAKECGFVFDIYTDPVFTPSRKSSQELGCFANVEVAGSGAKVWLGRFIEVVNSSVFTYLPHFLKRHYESFQLDWHWMMSESLPMDIQSIEDRFCPYDDVHFSLAPEKRVKLYHFFGIHPPDFNVNKGKAVFDRIVRYLNALKRDGLFEKTSVFIMADHGIDNRHRPAFLCNNNGNAPLLVSRRPFSYGSLGETYIAALKGNEFEVPESGSTRTFFYGLRTFDAHGNEVQGEVRSDYSGVTLQLLEMDRGQTVESDGTCFWTWTAKTPISYGVPVPNELQGHDMLLRMSADAIIGESMPEQTVRVFVNGLRLPDCVWKHPEPSLKNHELLVPAAVNTNRVLSLRLEIGRTTCFKDLGISTDSRNLGICIRGLKLQLDNPLSPFVFSHARPSRVRLLSGFSHDEPDGCWTTARRAEVCLNVPEPLRGRSIEVVWTLNPFVAPPKACRQRLQICAEGRILFKDEYTDYAVREARFVVPADCVVDGKVVLVLDVPDMISPAEAGSSADPRPLGVFLRACRMEAVGRK